MNVILGRAKLVSRSKCGSGSAKLGLSISFANLTTPIKPDHPLLTEILGGEEGGASAPSPMDSAAYVKLYNFMNSTKHIQESESHFST